MCRPLLSCIILTFLAYIQACHPYMLLRFYFLANKRNNAVQTGRVNKLIRPFQILLVSGPRSPLLLHDSTFATQVAVKSKFSLPSTYSPFTSYTTLTSHSDSRSEYRIKNKTMYSNNEVALPSPLTATHKASTESRIRQCTAIMKLQNKCMSGTKDSRKDFKFVHGCTSPRTAKSQGVLGKFNMYLASSR